MSSIQKRDYLEQVFSVKKARRQELAALPFSEKLQMWLEMKTFSAKSGWRTDNTVKRHEHQSNVTWD